MVQLVPIGHERQQSRDTMVNGLDIHRNKAVSIRHHKGKNHSLYIILKKKSVLRGYNRIATNRVSVESP